MKPTSPAPQSVAPRDRAVRDDATDAWITESGLQMRAVEVERARQFATFDRNCSYFFHNAASMVEYAAQRGFGSKQTLDYVAAGRVFEVLPMVVDCVLDGSMVISTVAAFAPLILEPDLVLLDKSGLPMTHEEIVAWARFETDREILKTIRRLREEVRTQAETTARTLHMSAQGIDDLERTRTLLTRKKKRAVSETEAVEHTLRDWVSRNDDMETKGRKRRTGEMSERKDGRRNKRYVPAEVLRELLGLHGDRCAIQGCPHEIWLQNAHKTPHALGGGNEAHDQIRLCLIHHAMWDHGEMRWVEDAAWPCGGYFRSLEGRILRLKKPQSEAPRIPRGPRTPKRNAATGPPGGGGPKPPPPPDRVREWGPVVIPTRSGFQREEGSNAKWVPTRSGFQREEGCNAKRVATRRTSRAPRREAIDPLVPIFRSRHACSRRFGERDAERIRTYLR